jgi:tetratricopeptide (TPR) repeat protein
MGVTGATGYRVKVIGPNLDWTSPDLVPGTEFDYPADAPPLTPGNSYKVIVTAGDTSSEEGESEDTSFAVLAASESEEVRENEAKIRSLNLGDAPTRLLIAHLYSSNNLYAEAIEQLEPLARDRQNTESALLLLLARLNRYTALELQAEDYYLGAAQRSKQVGDIDGEALAQHELGELYDKTLGRSSAARQSYSRAIELYRNDLGDEDTAKEIEEKLKQLK